MDHHFISELEESSIHLHDNLQFELKLEFNYNPKIKINLFTQEFYLFISESLHINANNYLKEDFYLDQTNFIRYKTPDFTFNDLLNPLLVKSPLNKIPLMEIKNKEELEKVINEIKLFGNIFRSTLRDDTLIIIQSIVAIKDKNDIIKVELLIMKFCKNIVKTHYLFLEIKKKLNIKHENHTLNENLNFVDEFITDMIEHYLIGILEKIRSIKLVQLAPCDQKICELLIYEKKHRENELLPAKKNQTIQEISEMVSYRLGLLNKFMMEVLQLKNNRISPSEQHEPAIASIAAGVAMLIYMTLFIFIWHSATFVVNSIPFVMSVVVFYILKDRIKDGFKTYYKKKSKDWLPDFNTKIYSPENTPLGELRESFSFIKNENLPEEIDKVRNKGFHTHFETLHRHETIIYYKREVKLFENLKNSDLRHELNMIFRYNIHRYLQKASDPIQYQSIIDENNFDLIKQKLPKLYHLNIVMKQSFSITNEKKEFKIKKFRVILDKRGIKEIENL